jgi:hypothetical protein
MTPNSSLPYPILDGFRLKTLLRCNLTFGALAIEQFNALRRVRAFRSKGWTVPNDTQSQLIPAFGSYEYQVEMKPGSAIWGYTFTGNADGTDSFQVRETCTDVPLFSESVTKQPETAELLGAPIVSRQQFLSGLLVVPAPGLLHVEIATTSSEPRAIQLILWGGEPA